MTDERVTLGTKIALRLMLFCAGLYILYLIRSVVFVVLFAILTSVAIAPLVSRLQQWKLSRSFSVVVAYLLVFLGSLTVLGLFVPLFFSEAKTFLTNWSLYATQLDVFFSNIQTYLGTFGVDFEKESLLQNITSNITGSVSNVFSFTVGLFENFIHFIGFFFLSLYLSLEEQGIEKFFLLLTPKKYHTQALSIVTRMRSKVSQWLFGQVLLMVIAFVMYYIGLTALGIPYALAIAFFGGVMEILPYIGPVFAALPALLIGFLISPVLGISTLVFYVIAHQIEAHIIAPQVMKHSAGLNPVVLIIAILIGSELAGPLGIILSVPLSMMLLVFVDDILEKKIYVK